jgi:hypothetical protein
MLSYARTEQRNIPHAVPTALYQTDMQTPPPESLDDRLTRSSTAITTGGRAKSPDPCSNS